MSTRRAGFNLLEVIIASFVFLCIVAFSVTVWMTHYKAVGKARYDALGMWVATETIERLIDATWSGAESLETLPGQPELATLETRVRGQDTLVTFEKEIIVEDLEVEVGNPSSVLVAPDVGADGVDDMVKSAMVIVRWTDPLGKKKEVRLETYLSSQ